MTTAPTMTKIVQAATGSSRNFVLFNPTEYGTLRFLAGETGDGNVYFLLGGKLMLVGRPDMDVLSGTIQLGLLQRKTMGSCLGDAVSVEVVSHEHVDPILIGSVSIRLTLMGRKGAAGAGSSGDSTVIRLDTAAVVTEFLVKFASHVMCIGQELTFNVNSVGLKAAVLTIEHVSPGGVAARFADYGLLGRTSLVVLERAPNDASFELTGGTRQTKRLFDSGFSFEKLGVGGLDKEFSAIFRRAFASRLYPGLMRELGMNHVRGLLLYGAPGCGKTLIARKIGQALHAKEPKKVNGPEILNKYVGQSEANIRALFADAEEDQRLHGDDSELHIIIFDEIDAICKQRGSSGAGSSGVGDSVVNQLLSKIDGVDALNNILLIGMTNRKDLIDDALLRPGRLEVHVEIGLPDEAGRASILMIHTAKARESGRILEEEGGGTAAFIGSLARDTKNYTGAELEGLVRDAASHALVRVADRSDITKAVDTSDIVICADDFRHALAEIVPQFGTQDSDLLDCYKDGIINFGECEQLRRDLRAFGEQVHDSDVTPFMSVLLSGGIGSGKTALSAQCAMECDLAYKKRVSADVLVGFTEQAKIQWIQRVFEDAYRTNGAVIILDDIERLVEYVPLGQRFSNAVLQALLVLIKKPPPKNRKLLVIGTTSNESVLTDMGVTDAFNVRLECPYVHASQSKVVLSHCFPGCDADVTDMCRLASWPIGMKRLLLIAETARGGATDIGIVEAFRRACATFGCLAIDGV